MRRALLLQSLRDSWLLLAGCCVVTALFLAFRIWVASQIDFGAFEAFLAVGVPKFVEKLLPVPVEVLGTPEGRVAYGFEEFPVIVLSGLWAIARGSECLSGRLSAGTMEMLLAQPIRRFTLFATHTLVTLAGAALLGLASWLGTGLGVAWSSFAELPELRVFTPAAINLVGLCIFFAGFTTLLSAVTRTRSQTVAIAIGFYVVQLTLMILALLSPDFRWLQGATILNAYDPTALAVGLQTDFAATWPQFCQYNAILFGLGAMSLAAAAAVFCWRDVPAPM